MTAVAIVVIVFAAAVIQCLSGFGFALIIMPLITLLLGLRTAAPLVALTALCVYVINLIRYRQGLDRSRVLRLAVSSALGVPVGIWMLSNLNEALIKALLGLVLIAYALYALLRPTTQRRPSRRWIYVAGFLAGCLGGAYNTPGPPAIVYGSLRQWPRDEFRAILQALFLVNGSLVVASHLVTGHINADILTYLAFTLPALGLGILVGSRLDAHINQERFRTIVSLMILALGLSLLLGSWWH